MNFYLVIILFSIFHSSSGLNDSISTHAYHQMPPLYRFDDYKFCLGNFGDEALYCVANSFIKPDPKSELYTFIKDFSMKTKQHFRHDKLQRGLCVNTCQEIVQKLGGEAEKYFVKEFPMDSNLTFDFVKYPNAEEHRKLFNEIINKCVNLEIMETFNLSAYSSIDYCLTGEAKQPLDSLEILANCIAIFIISLVVLSSVFDRHLRNLSLNTSNHYKTYLKTKTHRVLTIFSLRRNWNILAAPTAESVRDLRFIEALRTLILFGVIHNHCVMFSITLPSMNPIFIDDTFNKSKLVSYMSGNPGVQTYLVIGGFLTAFLFMKKAEKDVSSINHLFIRGIIGRYIRFAPLLIFTILVHSTWLYRLGDGPFWNRLNFSERQFCRDNWWTNLLFLDNYINVEQKCLIHSWYLASDFWLRILATFCLIQILRKPALKFQILSGVLAFSAACIGYTVYVNKLEPISIFPPEDVRNQLWQASPDQPNYFKILYSPTHLNIGNYFIGVIAGLLYHEQKKLKQQHVKTWWLRVFFYLCLTIAILTIYSSYIFYVYDFEKPSLAIAVAAAFLKHIWGFSVACPIIGLIYGYGWFARRCLSFPGFRIMGRISYATFMCHLFVVKLLMASSYQPIYLSDLSLMTYALAAFFLSNVIGMILTLFIEIPTTTICNMLNLKRGL